jgi:DNA-binding transcriptional LysR family regulator
MPWSDRLGSRLKLRDLRVFMAVANAGTMGRAAEDLAVSQPVISKAIADLEHALGVRLFDRSRRGVMLTNYGQSLRDSGLAIFDELRQSVTRLEALTDPTAGEVRVGTTEPLATGLISAALARMTTRYPKMKFHVVQGDLHALRTHDLRPRNIDFAVGRLLEPVSGDEFAYETLFDDPIVVFVGRSSKWAKRRNIRLAELVNERWVMPPIEVMLANLYRAFDAAGLQRPQVDVLTLSIVIHDNLLATGQFVTALARSTFGWGEVPFKALPIDMPTTIAPVAIVTLTGRTLSAAAMLFLDCLRELVAKRENELRRVRRVGKFADIKAD